MNLDKILQKSLTRDTYWVLHNKIDNLEQQCKMQKEVIDKAIEYLTSYSSIHTIQFGTENDSLNDIELNKTLDEKTLNEMTYRYLLVHDKLLEILEDKRGVRMKTLKEIKEIMKNLDEVTIISKRGNEYKCKICSIYILYDLRHYKTININPYYLNDITIYHVSWYGNKQINSCNLIIG